MSRGLAPAAERLDDWVAYQAEHRPDAVAVVAGDRRLTYGEFHARASGLARLLHATGCRRGDRVGLLAAKSPAAVAAMVGTYAAGATLVPLDPATPAARLAKILRSCAPRYLLGEDEVAVARLSELHAAGDLPETLRVGWLGGGPAAAVEPRPAFTADDLARGAPGAPSSAARGDDPAHILFTSGSTGEPKGVIVTHRSAVRFVDWAVGHFGIGPDERLSCHSPLHFDLSTFDLFGAFAAGAQVHLVPPQLSLLPHRLAELIRRSQLTQWFSVPSLLVYMAQLGAVEQDDFPALRRLLWCGEVFPTPSLRHWLERLPHVAFANLYGPTEAAIASSFYDVPAPPEDERAEVPIGRGCSGEELLVLDRDLVPVPTGRTGDLYIGGVGLSPGYWMDPAKTAEAFVPHPAPEDGSGNGAEPGSRIYRTGDLARVGPDGEIDFLGRADTQIKSRGYRIELGEVEAAVAAVGLTGEAVVTAVPTDGFEGKAICCAYVPAAGRAVAPAELRSALARLLPAYMLPVRWQAWDRLPRNRSGKLDRNQIDREFRRQETGAEVIRASS